MYFADSQSQSVDLDQDLDFDSPPQHRFEIQSDCSQGHRSSLSLSTEQGGRICLLCLSNLLTSSTTSTPRAPPTLHVSYALSQLSRALAQPQFLHSLVSFRHAHILVSPLVHALSFFDDDCIARQLIDVITVLCRADSEVFSEFFVRVAESISSGALAWSQRQVHMIHCFGVLLNCDTSNSNACINDKCALVTNLVAGLQLPSEEIQGEILFVLYKLSILQYASKDDHAFDVFQSLSPKLLDLSLQALLKTQADDVRLNCVAFLTILARKGYFGCIFANDTSSMSSDEADSHMHTNEDGLDGASLSILFAEAIKGPLLSTDSQVQIITVDLLFHYMSTEGIAGEQVNALVKENIADYVFEILRLSKCEDMVVNSCLRVLTLFSTAEKAFSQRLLVGFATLIPVLHYVADIPFHPSQSLVLQLIWSCISDCPGIVSTSHIHELILILTRVLKKHTDEETSMLPEAFIMACSIFVSLLNSPTFQRTSSLATSVKEASKHAVLACLTISENDSSQLLHSLYLLKEVHIYSCGELSVNASDKTELRNCVLDISVSHILPWFKANINEMEEDTALGVFETFHSILLQDCDIQATEFAKTLLSSSWVSLSFGCLGLFPAKKMKWRVYLMLSSLVDLILGNDSGRSIGDSALYLPSDPNDLLYLLGQKSSRNFQLSSSQLAVLLILHAASLFDDRLADEKLVLASLEQHILVNSSDLLHGGAELIPMNPLLNLYCMYRGYAKISYHVPYSPEAERIFFLLLAKCTWDLPSAIYHSVSLKWIFQQENIIKLLSDQMLEFCQRNISNGTSIVCEKNCNYINVKTMGELVAGGDNYAAKVLICLLEQLVENQGQEQDIISVLNLMESIIISYPSASDQFCLYGIGNAIRRLYYNPSYSSLHLSKAILLLLFNILCFVQPKVLSDEEPWLAVAKKLMNYLDKTGAAQFWSHEGLLAVGIFCLILNRSTSKVLVEVSKAIMFDASLVSKIDGMISDACSKGPALTDCDEATSNGENIIFVLLLYYFTLRSLQVLEGAVDWQDFMDSSNKMPPLGVINIQCDNLCRMLHFGAPLVKLIASYCMLNLFTGLSDQKNEKPKQEFNCSFSYLMSTMAILEGLVFYSDSRVAMNCSRCLSMIIRWEKVDLQEKEFIAKTNWCRLIIEEMAMSLAVPCMAPKSLMKHHESAIHIAIALLKLQKVPEWMGTVFDDSCISAIIDNLTASNMTADTVLLFRELLNSEFLKAKHIAGLNHVLQACRKRLYTNTQDNNRDEDVEKSTAAPDGLAEACEYLICLMSSESSLDLYSAEPKGRDRRLLAEIEMFFQRLNKEGELGQRE